MAPSQGLSVGNATSDFKSTRIYPVNCATHPVERLHLRLLKRCNRSMKEKHDPGLGYLFRVIMSCELRAQHYVT